MQDYITKLTNLQRNFNEAIREKNPDLSPEGQQKAHDRIRAGYKADLERLSREFRAEAEQTIKTGREAVPAAPSDTRQDWEKAKMLLEAGMQLRRVVAQADPAMLHAIKEWGPTYLQAESLKGKSDPWASDTPVDATQLERSIRNRWAEVLDGFAPGRIARAGEAEAVAAQFNIAAEHFGQKLDGIRGQDDLSVAIAAQLAGQSARAALPAADAAAEASA
jgi:hypothetical protein